MLLDLLFKGFIAIALAQSFTIPLNDGYVTDTVDLLTEEQEQQLEEQLTDYKNSTSNEVAIVIVPTLAGRADSDVAVEIIRKWGIGDAENNNGVLLLHAYEDRRVYIGVGYGLEGALPDLVVDGIIALDIIPAFQDGEYALGYTKAVEALQKHIGNEYTADRYSKSGSSNAGWIFFLFFLLEPLAAWLGSSKQWWQGGIVGLIGGILLVFAYNWWLSIPLLVLAGLFFDYLVSNATVSSGRRSNRNRWGSSAYRSRSSGRSFGGFGGGSSGGGGAGRSY